MVPHVLEIIHTLHSPPETVHQTPPNLRSTGSIVWCPDQQIMLILRVVGGVSTIIVADQQTGVELDADISR